MYFARVSVALIVTCSGYILLLRDNNRTLYTVPAVVSSPVASSVVVGRRPAVPAGRPCNKYASPASAERLTHSLPALGQEIPPHPAAVAETSFTVKFHVCVLWFLRSTPRHYCHRVLPPPLYNGIYHNIILYDYYTLIVCVPRAHRAAVARLTSYHYRRRPSPPPSPAHRHNII